MTTDTPTGLLLSGPSSTGKTTLGRVIHDLLPTPWVTVPADLPGLGFPRRRAEFVTLDWDHRLREATLRAARAFTDSGLNTVLEQGLWDPWGATMAARVLGNGRWFVINVTCDLAAAEAREAIRADRRTPGTARQQHAEFTTSPLDADFTVDTTGKDPREVARQLGAWLDTGLVPTALRR